MRVGKDGANTTGACVEKKRPRKDRQERWSVDVDVVGDCDRTLLTVMTICET